jgi:hypothetical protein
MADMKVHCASIKGGTRSVISIDGTMPCIFDRKSCNKQLCALANAGKTFFAQFPKTPSIHRVFSYEKMKDGNQEMFTPPLETDSEFIPRAFANPCTI